MQSVSNDVAPVTEASKGDILVRQYGLQDPLDWDKDCHEHLFLMNKLWNRLVEIERENTRRYFEVVGADPAVAEVQIPLTQKIEQRRSLVIERNTRRAAARSRQIDTGDLDEQIETLSTEIRELTTEAKKRRQVARKLFKSELDTLELQRREKVKIARQTSGLWWSNYNAVLDAYNVARSRALKTGGELQFHAFDGSGRFTCQIQGGTSVQEIYSGARSEVRMDPVHPEAYWHESRGERRRLARSRLTITVYTDKDEKGKLRRRTLTFPIHLHRPIPEEAIIKEVEVVRRRIGSSFKWLVTFTCRMPGSARPTHPSREACAIDIGWRKRKDGLRIATIVDTQDSVQHIVLPTAFFDRMARVAHLQSLVDAEFNDLQQQLRERLPGDEDIPEGLRERLTSMLRSRNAKVPRLTATKILQCAPALSMARRDFPVPLAPFGTRRNDGAFRLRLRHGRGRPAVERSPSTGTITLAHNGLTARAGSVLRPSPRAYRGLLASALRAFRGSQRWNDNHPDFEPKTLEYFDIARKRIKRMSDEAMHLREKALGFRKDYYWNAAKKIATAYAAIAIEEFNLTRIAKVKTAVGNQPTAPAEVRKMRQYAAVSEFRQCLLLQAAKTGSIVEFHDASFTSLRCRHCGHINSDADPYDVLWTCGGCGDQFDQDMNAAFNILDALRTSPDIREH